MLKISLKELARDTSPGTSANDTSVKHPAEIPYLERNVCTIYFCLETFVLWLFHDLPCTGAGFLAIGTVTFSCVTF